MDSTEKKAIGTKIRDASNKKDGIFEEAESASKSEPEIEDVYLEYITFMSAIDYQKGIKADDLWKKGKAWAKMYPWLFKPNELMNKPIPEVVKTFHQIRITKDDSEKSCSGFLRPQDLGIWLFIAHALKEHGGSTKSLLKEFNYDAFEIYEKLRDKDKQKEDFPFLSGDKILPMWLKILNEDAGIELKNMDKIPLPVDVNVARVTYNLIFKKDFDGTVSENMKKEIRNEWNSIAKEIGVNVINFDTPLWTLGSKGCSEAKKTKTKSICEKKCTLKDKCYYYQKLSN